MNPFNTISPEIKQLYKTVSQTNNPMDAIMKLAQNNPNLQPIVQMLQNGANPEQLFYQMCSSRGVNPRDILNQLK